MKTSAVFSNAVATIGGGFRRETTSISLFSRNTLSLLPRNKLKKLQHQLCFNFPNTTTTINSTSNAHTIGMDSPRSTPSDTIDINWDTIGFGLVQTDYMYTMKCSLGESFSKGELVPFGNINISPCAGVLNYGQGLFEGLKAYRTKDDSILLFRPRENASRMINGAERMCMPSPSIDQFVQAVKKTVLANEKWIPPPGKGSLYIRPLLIGSGSVLGLAPALEYTFLIYVSPVGNYFNKGLSPINLIIETEMHRATPGGTGGVKTIGNYAAVLKAQGVAKAKGYTDVLYLDSVHKKYLEEVSSCNIFIVKVEERRIIVDELLNADEVFCTGTAVGVSSVDSVTYLGKRVIYGRDGADLVSEQLCSALTGLQMGLVEDKMSWIVKLK
ncbi:hypothetical protein LXL04_005667 [Taraxacum kok-saghyz]